MALRMSLDAVPIDDGRKPGKPPKARLLTLDSLDRRTAASRRAHELITGIATDLGGAEHLTEGSRQLVQRAAVLGAFIEDCEARWIGGEPFEVADYLPAINAQRRILETLGLERRARDVTPSLANYLAAKAATKPVEASISATAAPVEAAPDKTRHGASYESGEDGEHG
jgi:hypothetical protein